MDGMALARLRPESLAERTSLGAAPGWQQRKSLATRNSLLDAALQCLAEVGYSGFTLQEVARRAGISRGAMLHHYASKLELTAAVTEYAFYRRMALFLDRIRSLTDEERSVRNAGVRIFFEICQTPEYRAYLELHAASRTDPELSVLFLKRARLYDRIWREESGKVFPEWAGDDRLEQLNDLVWTVVDGLALNADIWADPARVSATLETVAQIVAAARAGTILT